MNRKLLAIDVDGTLLNDRLELSKKSVEVLRKAQEQGCLIVLSSGRPWRSIAPYYAKISCKSPVICYNGAHVYDPSKTMKEELKITFPKDEVIAIANSSKGIVTSFMVEGEKGACLLREDLYLNKYFPYRDGPYKIGPIEKNLEEDTYTLLFRCHPSHVAELQKIVESHPHFKYRHWSSSFYSEAYLEGTSKGSALPF
jgi:hydroxymethylpyrimidine pyrophosphatase-like HAD family hydrolase